MRIAALLLVAALLAGCSSSPEADPDDADDTGDDLPAGDVSGDGGGTPAPGSTPPAPPAALANAPPTVELTATAYEGPAPFDVTFLLEASDEDGDALTYNVGFGDGSANATGDVADDGSASVNHTFAAEGTYTVVVAVFDGTEVSLANATVVVAGDGAAASSQAFYFSSLGSCSADALVTDLGAAAADSTFCTFQATDAAGPASQVGPVTATAAEGASAAPAGTAVSGQVHLSSCFVTGPVPNLLVGDVTVEIRIQDGASLGSATMTIEEPAVDKYNVLPFAFTTAADIPEGAIIQMVLDYSGTPVTGIVWGGGAAEPTGFAIGGIYSP